MRLAALVAALAGLLQASTTLAADPAADVASRYTVRGSAQPAALKAGASGALTFAIEPTGGVHVDPKAPLKITLSATPGLVLSKERLGRPDATPAGAGLAFKVPFTAGAAGKQEVKVKLDFFLCTDQWCVKQVRELTVAVDVT
jgi:hypothetical protein